jgi:hypothetical protein
MHGWCGDCSTPRRSSKSKKKISPVGDPLGDARQRRRAMMDAVVALAPTSGLTAGACAALNVPRAGVYRQRARLARPLSVRRPRPSPRRALADVERQTVLDLLRTPRFADQAPAEVYASLLDEGGLPLLDPHHVPHPGRQPGSPRAPRSAAESFGQLWDYEREGWARRFFENWRASLKWQRLKPYQRPGGENRRYRDFT